jgi:hypothetical protein
MTPTLRLPTKRSSALERFLCTILLTWTDQVFIILRPSNKTFEHLLSTTSTWLLLSLFLSADWVFLPRVVPLSSMHRGWIPWRNLRSSSIPTWKTYAVFAESREVHWRHHGNRCQQDHSACWLQRLLEGRGQPQACLLLPTFQGQHLDQRWAMSDPSGNTRYGKNNIRTSNPLKSQTRIGPGISNR